MIKNTSEPYKVSENPFEQLVDRIAIFRQRSGSEFAARLKKIQGQRLILERRSGALIIVHCDDIVSASELRPRGRT